MNLPLGFWWGSPSTFTFAYWIVMASWLALQNYEIKARRIKKIVLLLEAAACVFIINIMFDNIWIIMEGLKFAALFESGWQEILFYLGRNIGFGIVAWIMGYELYNQRTVTNYTWFLAILMLGYFVIWFSLAPGMEWTDWTYAIRKGYSGSQVLASFLISHVIGKLIQGGLILSLWTMD